MALYAADGVFMPQNFPSSIGADAVRKAYDGVFRAITLTVKFGIAEIRQVGADWAFARTNSAGTSKVNATGESSREANQELFVFQKVGSDWKIARYCFSTTNPARA
jgi:ketosteroid isomerase-like protein